MKDKNIRFREIETWIEDLVQEKSGMLTTLQNISKLLKEEVEYYNWVGFYLVDKNNPDELILGPFEGAPTEHTRIPFGKGVCGQVASNEQTIIVQDVSQEQNYLSCSIDVRSEIVVPIFKSGKFIGEIDIDSHKKAPFSQEDTAFLENIAQKISELF